MSNITSIPSNTKEARKRRNRSARRANPENWTVVFMEHNAFITKLQDRELPLGLDFSAIVNDANVRYESWYRYNKVKRTLISRLGEEGFRTFSNRADQTYWEQYIIQSDGLILSTHKQNKLWGKTQRCQLFEELIDGCYITYGLVFTPKG